MCRTNRAHHCIGAVRTLALLSVSYVALAAAGASEVRAQATPPAEQGATQSDEPRSSPGTSAPDATQPSAPATPAQEAPSASPPVTPAQDASEPGATANGDARVAGGHRRSAAAAAGQFAGTADGAGAHDAAEPAAADRAA